MKIKAKLIILFVVIKVIPLLMISYIAVIGANSLSDYFLTSTQSLFDESKKIISNTASTAIDDSIIALNKKSQTSMEILSYKVANSVATFLYERDKDILFLSRLSINQNILQEFYDAKHKQILEHGKYYYDEKKSLWVSSKNAKVSPRKITDALLKDNKKEFNYNDPVHLQEKTLPIYKEVVFFDLEGNEKYKVSSINEKKVDISKKVNTYIKAENYFDDIKVLNKGEIYVSDVIGAYVNSKIIGTFTKEKAKKRGIPFRPELYGYAGKENPVGKKFEAIVRFITPVYDKNTKIGYISLALDHKHLMEYTDTLNPVKKYKQDIADASVGNYAFMWNFEGKNISHPRDYFIVGYNPHTGEKVAPWVSADIEEKYRKSNSENLSEFLETYPTFQEQSLDKKPNLKQLIHTGELALDCRYLNFAPQCQGWMQVTKNGGYGSFIIYWSNVWKLTTAATIPYYTGKYSQSKRGFGFVTIGANVDEFHAAANKTKMNIEEILDSQTSAMQEGIEQNKSKIKNYISTVINELSLATLLMALIVISIAVWMSNYITGKIENILTGTKKFAKHELDYDIKVTSNDEIGELERSFNNMAYEVRKLHDEQKELNEHLEEKVEEKTIQLQEINKNLEFRVQDELDKNRRKDVQLLEQSKMASMGEMISMIIHQWKQPLNAISIVNSGMRLRVMLNKLSTEDVTHDNNVIDKQVQLMSSTMDDFKNFFKQTDKIEFVVAQSIQKTIDLVGNIYSLKNVEVVFESKSQVKTTGYPNELIQVLINILNNARDIILDKKLKEQKIFITVVEAPTHHCIHIQDCAGGIPEEHLRDIFNPYFTTKKEDKGTGLGLYMTKVILDKVDATISVTNEKVQVNGKEFMGARFNICLVKA